MSDPYVGEIRMFGGNFAPYGWMFCDGSLISIADYETLYNLIGTTYGGNGQTTFGLPNLSGRIPIHAGQAQGTQLYQLGQTGGVENVTLNTNQIPAHAHTLFASAGFASASEPGSGVVLGTTNPPTQLYYNTSGGITLAPASVSQTGGSQPHDNMMPYLAVSFIISLFGVYPSPS
jgi:microcystin-dependent protein